MGSLALRPGDLLTILEMALSIGFRNSVSFLPAIQATGFLTLTPVGLFPTEHASLCWTRGFLFLPHRLRRLPSPTHSVASCPVPRLSSRFRYYTAVRLLTGRRSPLRFRL